MLEDLVEEDDSNPHTWHLLGMAYYGGHMLDEAQVGAAMQGLRACRLQVFCRRPECAIIGGVKIWERCEQGAAWGQDGGQGGTEGDKFDVPPRGL